MRENPPTDLERLEARILSGIQKLHRGNSLLQDLFLSVETTRSKLRNILYAFEKVSTQSEIDSLIYAIVEDDALPLRDILFCFNMSEEDYKKCTERLNERRRES